MVEETWNHSLTLHQAIDKLNTGRYRYDTPLSRMLHLQSEESQMRLDHATLSEV